MSKHSKSKVDSGLGDGDDKEFKIGNYLIGQTIGEGTFGLVKTATHTISGEKVAVKILEKNRFKEQADTVRVNREIKILKKTRHSNIIQLYEVLDTPTSIYLMMEISSGGEMFDYIVSNRKVAEPLSCNFFHQIIDGVEALHNNFVTHRDLKPENLLLKATPKGFIIKIVDFGLSNTHEGGKLLSTACGSPCYAAPEMIAGKKYVGPLVDIWSMGVILFTLVCGYLPFEDQNTSHLYKKILAGNYSTPKWLSANVKDLIKRILEIKPTKRISIADIRQHKWFSLVNDADIPREDTLVVTNDELETKTLKDLTRAGYKKDDILEGIASHSYNPTTASYFLLKQRNYATMQSNMAAAVIASESSASAVDTGAAVTGAVSEVVDNISSDLKTVPGENSVPAVVNEVPTPAVALPSEPNDITDNNNDQKADTTPASPVNNDTAQPQDQQLRQLQKFREQQQKRIQGKSKAAADKANTIAGSSTDTTVTNHVATGESDIQQQSPSVPVHLPLVEQVTQPIVSAAIPVNISIPNNQALPYLDAQHQQQQSIESQPVSSPVRVENTDSSITMKETAPLIITTENSNALIKEDEIRKSSIAESTIENKKVPRPTKETIPASFPRSGTRKPNTESTATTPTVTTGTTLKPLDGVLTGKKAVPALRSSPRVPLHIISPDVSIPSQPSSSRAKKILDPLTDMFKSAAPYPSIPSSTLQPSPRMMNLTLKNQQQQQQQSLPAVIQSAPDVATRSSVKNGGRKGRHLKAIVSKDGDSNSSQNNGSVVNPLDSVNSKLAQEFDGISIT